MISSAQREEKKRLGILNFIPSFEMMIKFIMHW